MIERKDCRHETLQFGSGDYYIFCKDCPARWASVSLERPEYGLNVDNKEIGTDATICNQGVGGTLSGEKRIRID